MTSSALMVVVAVGLVAGRAARRMRRATVSGAVRWHLLLALVNFLAAAGFGMLIGIDRSHGTLGLSPLTSAWADPHLAAIGWVMLMVIGMSYRLILMLPTAIPRGRSPYLSAVLIEIGLAILFTTLLAGSPSLLARSLLIVAAWRASSSQCAASCGRASRGRRPCRGATGPSCRRMRRWSAWSSPPVVAWR